MKKIIFAIGVLILSLLIIGCPNGNNNNIERGQLRVNGIPENSGTITIWVENVPIAPITEKSQLSHARMAPHIARNLASNGPIFTLMAGSSLGSDRFTTTGTFLLQIQVTQPLPEIYYDTIYFINGSAIVTLYAMNKESDLD